MQRLAAALAELGAGIRVDGERPVPLPMDGRLLTSGQIWNLTTRYGDLDITAPPAGTSGYEALRRGATRLRVDADLAIDSPASKTSSAPKKRPTGPRTTPPSRRCAARSSATTSAPTDDRRRQLTPPPLEDEELTAVVSRVDVDDLA
jgi:hypothetical protein